MITARQRYQLLLADGTRDATRITAAIEHLMAADPDVSLDEIEDVLRGSWESAVRAMRIRLQAFDHGSISTPGFIMPFGSSSRLAPRSARANSSGRCLS